MHKSLYTTSITIKEFNEKDKTFTAYGSTFNNLDRHNDVMMKGAFDEAIAKAQSTGKYPKLLYQHRSSQIAGIMTDLKEDEKGLVVSGRFIDTDVSKNAYTELKEGAIDSMSIGGNIAEYEIKESEKDGSVWYIKKFNLWEVSFVTFPANEEAMIQEVKAEKDLQEMIATLKKNGYHIEKKEEDKALVKGLEGLNNLIEGFINE